jgi:hypothetical protein
MRIPIYKEYDPRSIKYENVIDIIKSNLIEEFGKGDIIHIVNEKVILDAEHYFILAVYQTK